MPLKISNLNRFGFCTDSQNRGTSVDHHIYTSHYLRFKHDFVHVLRICFCRDCSLFCLEFSLFSRRFSLFWSEFSLFSCHFLCFAVSFLYFFVGFLYFAVRFIYFPVSFLYFVFVAFNVRWVFFILLPLPLFCQSFSLFCRGFMLPWLYIAVVLFFLPRQLWATVSFYFWTVLNSAILYAQLSFRETDFQPIK